MTTAQPLDVQPTPLALLLLGREADPKSERGVECPGDLPPPSDPDLVERARAAKEKLGDKVFILGHHYQRDEVIEFADVTGDSFKLARDAAARPEAEYIVFCGVHFMAESADILTGDDQKVVLPDLAAGCSMADMATAEQVAECWDVLTEAGVAEQVVPVSYMNSSADIKAFTGKHGGTICTSSNAKRALDWAFEQGEKVLFLPDQHLGRNTAVRDLGMSLEDCVVYNPHKPGGGLTAEQLRNAKMILWRGHCSVHGRFSLESVKDVRARIPGVNVLVHPECKHEVVAAADYVGLDGVHHQGPGGRARRIEVGDRHRAEPRPPPGEPFRRRGQGNRLPRQDGLLLLDDEPHRPPPPGVDPGVAGGRQGRQPHRGRQGDGELREARAGADAGAAVGRGEEPGPGARTVGAGPRPRRRGMPPAPCASPCMRGVHGRRTQAGPPQPFFRLRGLRPGYGGPGQTPAGVGVRSPPEVPDPSDDAGSWAFPARLAAFFFARRSLRSSIIA